MATTNQNPNDAAKREHAKEERDTKAQERSEQKTADDALRQGDNDERDRDK